MLEWIAFLCLLGAVAILIALSIIDLKTRLLPNELVAGFATLGITFHLTTLSQLLPVSEILLGGIIGFGSLYLLRACANHIYKEDALGLGDVKLMGAGGLWLGVDHLMIALVIGATASMVHGLGYKVFYSMKNKNETLSLSRLGIPAGPGFAIGLIAAGAWAYRDFLGL